MRAFFFFEEHGLLPELHSELLGEVRGGWCARMQSEVRQWQEVWRRSRWQRLQMAGMCRTAGRPGMHGRKEAADRLKVASSWSAAGINLIVEGWSGLEN